MRASGFTLLIILAPVGAFSAPAGAAKAPQPQTESASVQEAPPPRMPEAELTSHLDRILAARSYPEANPSFEALASQEQAFPRLEKLLDNPKLHPEVRFYLIQSMLLMPAPGALTLAIRVVAGDDRDLRAKAVRRLLVLGDSRAREGLMDAALTEKDDGLLADMLFALGRTDAKAIPFLEGYLKKGQAPVVLNGAARALAQLASAGSAAKLLPLLDESMPVFAVDEILAATHDILGRPSLDRVLALARDPDEPLRLYGVNQLHSAVSEEEGSARRTELQAAAALALEAPSPMLRWRAVRSYGYLFETSCSFMADRTAVAKLLESSKDLSARVRLATLEAIHNTAMRRGLITPMSQPMALEAETMRMLRWPSDWLVFPVLIELLDDPDPAVREKALWILGISTGYWYGYPDIRLLGTPQITPDVKAQYRDMWDEMKGWRPEDYVRNSLDAAFASLRRGDAPGKHPAWMRGVKLLTTRTFGWSAQATPAQNQQALAAIDEWWKVNRDLSPGQWIVDAMRESGFKAADDMNLHVLGRWGQKAFDNEVFNPLLRKNSPDEVIRRILEWWKTAKSELDASPSPSPSR